jgi:hypothetical protein
LGENIGIMSSNVYQALRYKYTVAVGVESDLKCHFICEKEMEWENAFKTEFRII